MEIRHAIDSELENVCELLTTEFFDDPVLKYAFTETDRQLRMAALRHFFSVYTQLACKYGGVLVTEEIDGVLVYFRPEMVFIAQEEWDEIDTQLRQQCGYDYASLALLMNALERHHPKTPLHYYVFFIAVKKQFRRRGAAKSLLGKLNDIIDNSGLPCYAECTTLSTQALFFQAGYCEKGQPIDIDLFPLLYPVWRAPRNQKYF